MDALKKKNPIAKFETRLCKHWICDLNSMFKHLQESLVLSDLYLQIGESDDELHLLRISVNYTTKTKIHGRVFPLTFNLKGTTL